MTNNIHLRSSRNDLIDLFISFKRVRNKFLSEERLLVCSCCTGRYPSSLFEVQDRSSFLNLSYLFLINVFRENLHNINKDLRSFFPPWQGFICS